MCQNDSQQPEFADFHLPFGGKLLASNRWVELAAMAPWREVGQCYQANFKGSGMGAPAKSGRIAMGAPIIKERLGITDGETVMQIAGNPYLQYFPGLHEYRQEPLFDLSMMVHFRSRFGQGDYQRINDEIIGEATGHGQPGLQDPGEEGRQATNEGKLLVDATCMPADITDHVRGAHPQRGRPHSGHKPAACAAHRAGQGGQESRVRGEGVHQPHQGGLRGIGPPGLGRIQWGGDLIGQVEGYKKRFGHYPASVHADTIYRTRENRKYCKEHGIRITGNPLGRPRKETGENKKQLKAERKQRRQDEVDRIPVEGKFGEAKRKGTLDRIMAKLAHTSESVIHVGVIVLNLDKWLRELVFWLKTSVAAAHAAIRAAHRTLGMALCVQLAPSASPSTTVPSFSNHSLAA